MVCRELLLFLFIKEPWRPSLTPFNAAVRNCRAAAQFNKPLLATAISR